jgi:hypothetical protein
MKELKIGFKFQKYYNENNINNIQYCEIRGIVDDNVLVLFCKKNKTKISDYKEFYSMIYIQDFNYNIDNGIFIKL